MTSLSPETDDRLILVDSHAHLELEPLAHDVDAVMRRATDAGVAAVVTVGIDLEDAKNALEIADRFDNVFASVGFHPHNAKQVRESLMYDMEKLASHPKVVAYGEIGLDFFRDHSPHSVQRTIFNDQLQLAKDLSKPVVIHLRDAYEEGLTILEKYAPFPAGGVIHCFSGDENDAGRAIDLGFHVSVPGTVTYKKNDRLRAIVGELPEDRILLETDCPFLSPEPKRGKDNEPANIAYTAKTVAKERGVSAQDLARVTSLNAKRFFGLPIDV